jgi:hypothetical protein
MTGNPIHASMMRLKELVQGWRYSELFWKRQAFCLLKIVWMGVRFFTDAGVRSETLTGWKYGRYCCQTSTFTKSNRYPEVFRQVQSCLSDNCSPHILSYGCSTGEEVFTLGNYFPGASIVGVDINEWCIRKCQITSDDGRYSFFHRFSSEFMQAMNFDAIFCLAVLQRTENRTDPNDISSTGFSFDMFEREIRMLDGKLKNGGLFILGHSDFRFEDTECSRRYMLFEPINSQRIRPRALYDRNNRRLGETQNIIEVFVKLVD